MALVTLDNGQNILIDINIRASADGEDEDVHDVAQDLKDRLPRDDEDRPYVDAFLVSHPDADHVSGLRNHFHLGALDEYPDEEDKDRIVIREMWSSPIVFRRANSQHKLCDDAKAWATEARRRVNLFKEKGMDGTDSGDRILILGKDRDGKTDDIMDIVVLQDELITAANREEDGQFEARLLAPIYIDPDQEDAEELIDLLSKNNSSVILRFAIMADGTEDACRFLSGGDASVAIWDRLWQRHKDSNSDWLSYDVMETPHHCSWRTLSHDRWSEMGEDVKVSPDARNALSQCREGAHIVASSNPIKKEEPNPPHERAKREYVSITSADRFHCTEEFWEKNSRPIEFTISHQGPSFSHRVAAKKVAAAIGISAIPTVARGHGSRDGE
ncbi:metallohydrolase [Sinorhizobium medicae]|uniref:metallohydrolase n=2 Tax=Rhizobiaceae TaxID=82115 RepID=UPI001F1D61DF|nr:metallohydrolase [Sinorhizobium medicae]